MKTTIKSMMIVGMMILCTVSTFGKNNVQPRNHNDQPRQEMVVSNHSLEHRMDKPMPPHLHQFGRNHECKVCHLTEYQIHQMEVDMHKPMPQSTHRH